jgi:hypothetical protein
MQILIRAITGLFVLPLSWAQIFPALSLAYPAQGLNAAIRTATGTDPSLAAGVLKEIDDSCTGDQWLLLRDEDHPAGPGRLVRVARTGRLVQPGESEDAAVRVGYRADAPVIHAGDLVVLEESTPLVEARLEARALGPALCGAEFNARLTIGGRVVRAVALGKGRAAFVSTTGERP